MPHDDSIGEMLAKLSRWRICFALTIALTVVGGVVVSSKQADAPAVAAETGNRTIWDGVFSDAQAERGRASYVMACGYCHMDDLSGGGGDEPGLSPPGLAGLGFLARWRDASVAELAGTIVATMPLERPKLEPQTYVDIVAYLLHANGARPGIEELPVDGERLNGIVITASANR